MLGPKLIAATRHSCGGSGALKMGNKEVEFDGCLAELRSESIAVQHFRDGRTRPICDKLQENGICKKLRVATKQSCLIALLGRPHNNGDDEKYEHVDRKCKWLVEPF